MTRKTDGITVTETGFRLRIGRRVVAVEFDSIQRIEAYKEDLYVVDRICLDIFCLVEGKPMQATVHEEMPGFVAFREAVEARFGFSPQWYFDVMLPAFEENRQVIYERKE